MIHREDSHSGFDDRWGWSLSTLDAPHSVIRWELLYLLVRQMRPLLPAGLLVGAVVVGFLWNTGERGDLLIWFAALGVVTVLRMVLLSVVSNPMNDKAARLGSIGRRQMLLVLSSAVSGVVWGAGLLWFMDLSQPFQFALLLIVAVGIVAGAQAAQGAYWPSFAAFAVPILLPVGIHCLISGQRELVLLGGLIPLFLLLQVLAARHTQHTLTTAIATQFANRDLMERVVEVNERLKSYSFTDALTGVANRRHFDRALHRAWEQEGAAGGALSLLLIDLDHFKQYNDRFGHDQGDKALRSVGLLLGAWNDGHAIQVARLGGEEFAMLVRGGLQEAREIAERLLQQIRSMGISAAEESARKITASIGVASARPASGTGPKQLYADTDRMLYRAKGAGRDRVESA